MQVLDWDRTHKNVRSEDRQPVGNIVAVDDDCIIDSSQGGRSEWNTGYQNHLLTDVMELK